MKTLPLCSSSSDAPASSATGRLGQGTTTISSTRATGSESRSPTRGVADPKSGKEWERVGVIPDMPVGPVGALGAAHAAALDSLSRLAKDPVWARTLSVTQMGVRAQSNPPAISPRNSGSIRRHL